MAHIRLEAMLIMAHLSKGELDLGKLKPSNDYTQNDLEDFVYRLRRYGYKGDEYGSQAIFEEQKRLFLTPCVNRGVSTMSRATIERRINDAPNGGKNKITYAPNDPAYEVDSVTLHWRGYVARLSMISEFLFDRALTGREALVAEYVGASFNDPFGEEVDLIPQLAMVRQYDSYTGMSDSLKESHERGGGGIKSIENYFTYAPWKFGTGFYLNKVSPNALPVITDFMLFGSESGNWKEVSPVYDDALRQLGLPEWHWYWDVETDTFASFLGGFVSEDESKGKCNWMNILESDDNTRDTWAEIRPVPAEVLGND